MAAPGAPAAACAAPRVGDGEADGLAPPPSLNGSARVPTAFAELPLPKPQSSSSAASS